MTEFAAYHGQSQLDMNRFEDAAEIFRGLAAMHGLAHLVLEGKALRFFKGARAEGFLNDELPRVLKEIYPSRRDLTGNGMMLRASVHQDIPSLSGTEKKTGMCCC
ncbi:hypothetical protein [Tunturiibacter gelidiferens]|uniref:Uncharacterized protein n=1 Tax=Tunturiibacter gelidiferens TaxID=3069689 RepID=A0AAU7Z0J1_9BACT